MTIITPSLFLSRVDYKKFSVLMLTQKLYIFFMYVYEKSLKEFKKILK